MQGSRTMCFFLRQNDQEKLEITAIIKTLLCSETCTVVTLDSITSLYHGLQSPEWVTEMLELPEPHLSQLHALV